jgi:hypothetical protein
MAQTITAAPKNLSQMQVAQELDKKNPQYMGANPGFDT